MLYVYSKNKVFINPLDSLKYITSVRISIQLLTVLAFEMVTIMLKIDKEAITTVIGT